MLLCVKHINADHTHLHGGYAKIYVLTKSYTMSNYFELKITVYISSQIAYVRLEDEKMSYRCLPDIRVISGIV